MTASILGWSHTPFGKHDGADAEGLIGQVAVQACHDAGIEPGDVDEIVLGTFGEGFQPQGFPASLVLQADPAFRFKPATHLENACATGSAALHAGLKSIGAGQARFVLVIGVEHMTGLPNAEIAKCLLKAAYLKEEGEIEGGFVGVFARIAQQYFQKHGDQSDALAAIAAKNHRNGAANPLAQLQKDLGYEFCRSVSDKNPTVVHPLRRTDCSLVSDGAAALVLAAPDAAHGRERAVKVRTAVQVNDFLPMSKRDVTQFEGCREAWSRALDASGLTLADLDLVETHDCFTIAELIEYEAMGLCAPGQGARAALEGWTANDGKLPVNPSGGLKSKGHPIGATGVSMHVMAAMQLTGEAGAMQLPKAGRAGVFNMGGAAVANYVSILESGTA
ncbi:acetyl-CoA acetyltransferase [Rhodovibrio sodomensis]|uniref:Acetyl-CoA acetyltransferase n=1 Tax=Rhodovibrio sodomensis TaxID=1088 RepID=A0ABS1DFZ7_9PROT|nr:acetyl-CoA acetyltransferase [Rhodovibrio sodomensis]MBK1669399.1 acetyl-CoA acetyltransferase [Rhodovibrio sodomensis]